MNILENFQIISGHTHEDIDQLFSVISRRLREKKYIHTPQEFESFLEREVFEDSGNVHVFRLNRVYDIGSIYCEFKNRNLRGLG